jgi:epoxyqueuosine reductase
MSGETTLSKEHICQMAADLGFDDIGFAQAANGTPHDLAFKESIEAGRMGPLDYMVRTVDERSDIYQLMPDAKTVLVVVKNYFTGHYDKGHPNTESSNTAKVSRYAWGKDYHQWMRKKLRRFRKDILAYRTEAQESQIRIFNDTSPVLERAWAEKAGLGFIGKSTMFIHREMGTWTFLGGLVLNWEIEPDPPMMSQFCGTCTRCIDACPTQAFLAPGSLDANACLTTWSVERPLSEAAKTAPGEGSGWGFGCDVCQEVCPWNKFEQTTDEPRFQPLKGHQFLDPELSELPQALEGTAFARARREGVRLSTVRALKKTEALDLESE